MVFVGLEKLDTFFARTIVSWEKVVATQSVYGNTEDRYNVVHVLLSLACPRHARHLMMMWWSHERLDHWCATY